MDILHSGFLLPTFILLPHDCDRQSASQTNIINPLNTFIDPYRL